MDFDNNSMAGAFQDNALNYLLHVLLSDSVGVPKSSQDSIWKEFNKQHGTVFTFAEMIVHLKGLTPAERETKFGPVLHNVFEVQIKWTAIK